MSISLPALPAQVSPNLDTLAATVRAEHQAVGDAMGDMLEHAFRAGQALRAVKEQIPEGGWERVRKSCELSERSARDVTVPLDARERVP